MASDTKTRILDSAEILFAEQGIAATSLRALTDHAGVNLASVNYHFQSKDALVQAVLFRRLNPINERRMTMLNALIHLGPGVRPTVEQILDAFYRPMVEAGLAQPAERRAIMSLIGRIYMEPDELLAGQVRALMAPVASVFLDVLHLALPEVPQNILFWRLHFAVGVISHTFGAQHLIEGLSRGRVRYDDPEELLRQMISFAAGGLRGAVPCAQ